ncbi:uncharacterized protein LOC143292713 [Babylonia areolata]|uniref:uncharacterized protein LOC143292713 n=1 Tax=Babylonia areolata TaxID=304850 RepID=UPI003FD3EF86
MACRRFRARIFVLLVLNCLAIVLTISWVNFGPVKDVAKFKRYPSRSVEETFDGGGGGVLAWRDRSLYKKLKGERLTRGTSRGTADRTDYSAERHPWMFPRPLSELEHKVVPNQVFFVWCQNGTFAFKDYLSVLSAWKLMEPDVLEIHHMPTDVMGTDNYNQWLLELNGTVPAFRVEVVEREGVNICDNPLHYAFGVLSDRGGVYIDFSTVLLRSLHHLRNRTLSVGLNEHGGAAFVMSKKDFSTKVRRVIEEHSYSAARTLSTLRAYAEYDDLCPSLSSLSVVPRGALSEKLCVVLCSDLKPAPLDLHHIQNPDLTILRDLHYAELGKEADCSDMDMDTDEVASAQEKESSIPFIVHYVWFNKAEFSFRMYLSFLSTVHVAKARRVFIHCDKQLGGHYWQEVSSHPLVTVVYREMPHYIYGRRVLYIQHFSDVVRADVMDKYGGVYLDWDALWLRSPGPLLAAGHPAVVDLDHMSRPGFPEVLNLGVFLARPRARFLRLWRWELRNYRPREFFYNALELPFKVYERHPDTVHVEPRLQVMCFWLKCHPIFHPDHKDWQEAQPFDWRTDVYAIHFTHPDPEEYSSIVHLLNATGTFADIGKFILDVSGELDLH